MGDFTAPGRLICLLIIMFCSIIIAIETVKIERHLAKIEADHA